MIGALIARDVRRGFTGAAWLPIGFWGRRWHIPSAPTPTAVTC